MSNQEKKLKLYMHTLNGSPAEYIPHEQICWKSAPITRFATSLKQIRDEQKASNKWRSERGYKAQDYGYKLLKINLKDYQS